MIIPQNVILYTFHSLEIKEVSFSSWLKQMRQVLCLNCKYQLKSKFFWSEIDNFGWKFSFSGQAFNLAVKMPLSRTEVPGSYSQLQPQTLASFHCRFWRVVQITRSSHQLSRLELCLVSALFSAWPHSYQVFGECTYGDLSLPLPPIIVLRKVYRSALWYSRKSCRLQHLHAM